MKTILLTGRTEFITEEVVEQLSGRFSVVVTSEDPSCGILSGKVHQVRPDTSYFNELFWSYDFDAVWYFTPSCSDAYQTDKSSEIESVLRQCREASVRNLIMVSSSMATDSVPKEEELFLEDTFPRITLLRVPFLITSDNQNDGLGLLFSNLYNHKRKITLPDIEEGMFEFLSIERLIFLMSKMTLSHYCDEGSFVLPGEYILSRKQMEEEIASIYPGCRIEKGKYALSYMEPKNMQILSESYGYVSRDQKTLDFAQKYESFCQEERKRGDRSVLSRIRAARKKIPHSFLIFIDTVVLFLVAEYISQFTAGSVYFKTVDVRLIFILLIATFHGLVAGVVAALCECVVIYFQFHQLGISSMQLFYNVENWIPFVLYIILGAITGFFSDLRESEKMVVERENDLLREKYLFLNNIYNSTLEVKDAYRYQILGFDHSYGKICHALMELDCDRRDQVLDRGKEILKELLDNNSICIYQMDSAGGDARIIGDGDIEGRHTRTLIPYHLLQKALPDVENNMAWRNLNFIPGMPAFFYEMTCPEGDREDRHYLIAIWDALPEQMNDYYVNRFEMLCRLIGQALDRAAILERIPMESVR